MSQVSTNHMSHMLPHILKSDAAHFNEPCDICHRARQQIMSHIPTSQVTHAATYVNE